MEGLDEHAVEAKFTWVTELFDADRHRLLSGGWLRPIRSEQPIPPGQVETKVAVRFRWLNGMVHPVHVRGNDDPTQDEIVVRDAHVVVIEHRGSVEQHSEDEHGHKVEAN
jgi:hypothetical protein